MLIYRNPDQTDQEYKALSGLPINIVTARRNKLVDLGKVFRTGTKQCMETGSVSNKWSTKRSKEITDIKVNGLTNTQMQRILKNLKTANIFQLRKIAEEIAVLSQSRV